MTDIKKIAKILCEVRRGEPCHRTDYTHDDADCKTCDFAILNLRQAEAIETTEEK